MKGHRLRIVTLRDLCATCECGKWTLTAPTFDSDSDEYLVERANHQHRLHVEGVAWMAALERERRTHDQPAQD